MIIPYLIFLRFLEPRTEGIYKGIANSTAKFLRSQASLGGFDNAWEDFKEQAIGQHSIYWDDYVKTCEAFIHDELKKLESHVLLLLYINTKEFEELGDEEQEDEAVNMDAILNTSFGWLCQVAIEDWEKEN